MGNRNAHLQQAQGGLNEADAVGRQIPLIPHVNPNPRINRGQIRHRYTPGERENARRLLKYGYTYRQVAKFLSPNCSSGTPHRWRYDSTYRRLRREAERRPMEG